MCRVYQWFLIGEIGRYNHPWSLQFTFYSTTFVWQLYCLYFTYTLYVQWKQFISKFGDLLCFFLIPLPLKLNKLFNCLLGRQKKVSSVLLRYVVLRKTTSLICCVDVVFAKSPGIFYVLITLTYRKHWLLPLCLILVLTYWSRAPTQFPIRFSNKFK